MDQDHISVEELNRIVASKGLTADQEAKLKEILEIHANDTLVKVPDGFEFIRNLRKEARRQKAMRAAEAFEVQARDINHVPDEGSTMEEVLLAETFEIIEE